MKTGELQRSMLAIALIACTLASGPPGLGAQNLDITVLRAGQSAAGVTVLCGDERSSQPVRPAGLIALRNCAQSGSIVHREDARFCCSRQARGITTADAATATSQGVNLAMGGAWVCR